MSGRYKDTDILQLWLTLGSSTTTAKQKNNNFHNISDIADPIYLPNFEGNFLDKQQQYKLS